MPEQIVNRDGKTKQDCELNAAKRFLEKLYHQAPQLGLMIGGDGLFSNQPMIEAVESHHFQYLFVAKPDNHTYLMEWLAAYPALNTHEFVDAKGRHHHYEWMNDVPLHGGENSIQVNYLHCRITGKNRRKEGGVISKQLGDRLDDHGGK